MTHPITPPTELARHFRGVPLVPPLDCADPRSWIAEQIYQMGADQELEACCEVLARELICDGKHVATDLRMIRRPKPPSLKELALEALDRMDQFPNLEDRQIVRRALEALPE